MNASVRNILSKKKIQNMYLGIYPKSFAKQYVQGMIDFAYKTKMLDSFEKKLLEKYNEEVYLDTYDE